MAELEDETETGFSHDFTQWFIAKAHQEALCLTPP